MRNLTEIKKLRKQLNITQAELAKVSGVSQSLIAKIEAGIIDPGYSSTVKIFETIEKLKADNEPLAKDLMIKKIYSCNSKEKVSRIIRKMKSDEISQIPVIDAGKLVGLVTESSLIEHVFDKDIQELSVKEVMQESPPAVSSETPESAILPLLKHFPLVAILEKGELKGIITKADIIMKAYS